MDKNAGPSSSEQKILEAAKKVFLKKGMSGARMREIAEEAGINKALLHYYFRSKSKLFKSIFDLVFMNFGPKLFGIFNDDTPIEQKIDDFVNAYLDLIAHNPYLPLFIINEIQRNPELLKDVEKVLRQIRNTKIIDQLNAGIESGIYHPIKPAHFYTNLLAWCIFPFLTRPILDRIFGISEQEFSNFIEERKKSIPAMIMRSIKK
jgi:AcrR family transcriptional regulator